METNVLLTSSRRANPPIYGDSVTFTATVSPVNLAYTGYGTPSGSVEFYDETTGAAPGHVSALAIGGVCHAGLVSGLDAEDHYILAIYSGDATFVASTSDLIDQTSGRSGHDRVTVTATVGTPTYVDPIPVTFTATVSATNSSATVPTGETVEFYDQTTGNDLGTGTYDTTSQQWTLNTSDVAMDGDTVVAVYSGDGNFAGSQGTATVVGHTLSVDSPVVTYPSGSDDAYTFQGDVVTLSDGVSGLDGAAFTVTIDWGDGGQPETYSFAAPPTPGNQARSTRRTTTKRPPGLVRSA